MRGVLTLAGAGTRMLPWTRGLRKEFLPLFDSASDGPPVLKPVAHRVLESLVSAGIDDVTLVVGARDVEFVHQYFTVDPTLLDQRGAKRERYAETRQFYETLRGLHLHYAVQPAVRGFGDALLHARPYVDRDGFLLHAADAVLIERHRGTLIGRVGRLRESEGLDAVLLVRKVADPTRYGVVEGEPAGRFEGNPRLHVTRMEEKPAKPRSHWAATAVYGFSPRVFEGLDAVRRARNPAELEVTDAIRWLIDHGGRVAALVLRPSDGEWRSVGSPDGYVRALLRTRTIARRGRA